MSHDESDPPKPPLDSIDALAALADDSIVERKASPNQRRRRRATDSAGITIPLRSESAGMKVGNYTLVELLGQGGFGAVWLAVQTVPVARQVALKIIKAGMDTEEVLTRFEQERQALAMMDHPNIARIFDAGVTNSGRPYFVMELVRGLPLTGYCDQNALTIRGRLELFVQVCQAIQHAHQKGIIHRDLKPSNILVTEHDGVPVVRVIDFGVAKATEQSLTTESLHTLVGQIIGTPGYMSPEQADALSQDIDTRSDVYSLGAVLYELLTGTLPLSDASTSQTTMEALLRRIREQEPPRPSNRVTSLDVDKRETVAQQRSTEITRLGRAISGDLDWIVMKCLEKDRRRRFDSVSSLTDDILRHLNDEPVTARPPSAIYVAGRTFRRHKLAFSAGAAVLTALVVGLVASTAFFLHSEKQRKIAVRQTEKAQRAGAEQERLKTEAAEAAAKYRLSATTADYQLATRSLTDEADYDTLGYLARALETDSTNYSAAALGIHLAMSRPRVLLRKPAELSGPFRYDRLVESHIYPWQPADLMAREFMRMLQDPARSDLAQPHAAAWQNVAVPVERLIKLEDYPKGYTSYSNRVNVGWGGSVGRSRIGPSLELFCGVSPDRRLCAAVDREGNYAVYRSMSAPVLIRSGKLQGWPIEEFKRMSPHVFIDPASEWLAIGSSDIKTGGNNPACGIWNVNTGERVVNTSSTPVNGIEAASFHPSGSVAALGTFGRQALLVDVASFGLLPWKKTNQQIISHALFSSDGLTLSTGYGSSMSEFVSVCADHSAVGFKSSGSSWGESYEKGLYYSPDSLNGEHQAAMTRKFLIAKPTVFCGGVSPTILSLTATPNSIQWDASGDNILWCEAGKSIMKANVTRRASASEKEVLLVNESSPIKTFKFSQTKNRLIFTTNEGLHFAALTDDLRVTAEPVHIPAPDLGRMALNSALDKGCVAQRLGPTEVIRRFDMKQPKLWPGRFSIWPDKDMATDASIRDMEFSPDGSHLLLIGSGSPAYQLLSSTFLELETDAPLRITDNRLSTGLGADVAWDSSGEYIGRGTSGSGCQIHNLEEMLARKSNSPKLKGGLIDTGLCHLMAFVPGSDRYILSANSESKTVRLFDRELKELIAEWSFPSGIGALEVAPHGESFAVITGKRLEIHWLPPVDEPAPAWFPKFLRLLRGDGGSTEADIALREEIEAAIARGEGRDTSPRLCEAIQWALTDPRERSVFPGVRMLMPHYLEGLLNSIDPAQRKRALSTAILQNVRSPAIYREAAKNPPEGLSDASLKKWRDYYEKRAVEWKPPVAAPAGGMPSLAIRHPRKLPSTPPPLDENSLAWQVSLSKNYLLAATALRIKNDSAGALKLALRAHTIITQRLAFAPDDTACLSTLAECQHELGAVHYREAKHAEARKAFTKWVAIMEELTALEPSNGDWLKDLSNSQGWLANVTDAQQDWAASISARQSQIAADTRQLEQDSKNLEVRKSLGYAHFSIGIALRKMDRLNEAARHFAESLVSLEILEDGGQLAQKPLPWMAQVKVEMEAVRALMEKR